MNRTILVSVAFALSLLHVNTFASEDCLFEELRELVSTSEKTNNEAIQKERDEIRQILDAHPEAYLTGFFDRTNITTFANDFFASMGEQVKAAAKIGEKRQSFRFCFGNCFVNRKKIASWEATREAIEKVLKILASSHNQSAVTSSLGLSELYNATALNPTGVIVANIQSGWHQLHPKIKLTCEREGGGFRLEWSCTAEW